MEQKINNIALLVMDMQAGTLAMMTDSSSVKENSAEAIAIAREKKIPVIYVVLGFRNGTPEISTNNKRFTDFRAKLAGADMEQFSKVDASVAPLEGDIIVIKRRVSAFTGSDLEVILRAQGIQHIVLTGIATGGVVLSTLREAADKDFRITVLADCCADGDEEIHRVLTTKVFPRQADVITVEEWRKY